MVRALLALALLLALLPVQHLLTSPASLASALGLSPASLSASVPTGWYLTWSDEFDGATLDPHKWTVASDAPGGYHGCCLGYGANAWNPADVTVAGGTLRIRSDDQPFAGKPYSSGAITSQGHFAFRYGRVEIRAKLPSGAGVWPAFWLLPVSQQGWLAPYEIDMMEQYGPQAGIAMTLHWGAQQAACTLTGPDFSADYHVFSITWTPAALVWSVDGRPVCAQAQHIPDVPMYLILNTAIGRGGSVAGQPTRATVFPQELRVDDVRVYEPTGSGGTGW